MNLNTKRANRLRVLRCVYEFAEGSQRVMCSFEDIGKACNLSTKDVDHTVEYLEGECLVNRPGMSHVTITHLGAKEVEDAIADPNRPTKHFPPINIVYVGTMNCGNFEKRLHDAKNLA